GRALHARDGDIRGHVGAHLSVPKKWSKVCVDRGIQFELRSCGQCSEGRCEWTCCEGSGGLSDPALENQWQGYAPSMDLVKTRSCADRAKVLPQHGEDVPRAPPTNRDGYRRWPSKSDWALRSRRT